MEDSLVQIVAAIIMVAIAIALVFGIRRYRARASERRLRRMLESTGLDPDIAADGNLERIMGEVRQRCQHCQSEGLCERWLDGRETGSNEFCPNSRVFEVLGKFSADASR